MTSSNDHVAGWSRPGAGFRARVAQAGTHPGMPEAAGGDFGIQQIWIFTLTGGLIAEIRAVSDRLSVFLQLGCHWPTAGRGPRAA
jgi:hypothetical protein